jgi:hypothetical protein
MANSHSTWNNPSIISILLLFGMLTASLDITGLFLSLSLFRFVRINYNLI